MISNEFKQELNKAIRLILDSNFDADSRTCFLTLLKIIDNILQKPDNPKVRSIRTSNPAIRSKIIDRQGHHLLVACGFVRQEEPPQIAQEKGEERLVLLEPNHEWLVHARHTLSRIAILELNVKADSIPKFQSPKNSTGTTTTTTTTTGFDVYSGSRFDGQSAALGRNLGPPVNWKSKTEQELQNLKAREAKLEKDLTRDGVGMDRQWAVFLPGQTTVAQKKRTDVPAAISSKGDSQLLASHFQKQHAARKAQENKGFTTKAMRDLERLKKQKLYSHTQLAISFPDGILIKANFAHKEGLSVVMDNLRSQVFSSFDMPSFELYQTPPRTVLDPSKTLQELGLVPAAKVYLSWKEALPQNNNNNTPGWYIRPDRLSNNDDDNSQGTTAPRMPTSIDVAPQQATKTNSKSSTNQQRKKSSASSKEAALLRKMMGK